METLEQNLKKPLRTMKFLFILYILVGFFAGVLGVFTANVALLIMAVFLALPLFLARFAYRGLVEGKKSAWVVAIVLSSMTVASIFFPLGIYSLIGLMDKSVRAHCLD
ncbi:hypothetical protein [Bdellovibrio sp. HCB-162]|uniref:hypothetical protein n=1 Tax=Bdellovibrio sp. HCB-162 TaxID=3394234 RepID=UPI0039BC5532